MTATEAPAQQTPIKAKQRLGDLVFSRTALISGATILVILALVASFLIAQSLPALVVDPEEFIGSPPSLWDYVWPLIFGTLWSATLALAMTLPLAVGIALFISHYAPRRLAQFLGYIIDLLAAVPSVVFGLWGIGREIFLQTTVLHEEAALALGATRWEMITMAVLPFGRPGIISGAMLGLGRALGETMAVAMVLSPQPTSSRVLP